MKNTLLTAFAASTLALSMSAFAAHDDKGLYADVGAGLGKVNVKGPKVHNRGFSGTANIGYQFTPHLAVEGGATVYRKVYKVKNYNAHIAVKGILPVKENIDLFGKVGAAYVHGIGCDGKAHKRVAPYVGTGMTYWVNEQLGATLQGEMTPRRGRMVPAMYGASLGLTYKFN